MLVHQLVPQLLDELTLNFKDVLTRTFAYCACGAVWTHTEFNINTNFAQFMLWTSVFF